MKVYLDNCCYNRPYDDQSQIRVFLETQAKLRIQALIRDKELNLVSSFMLDYENSKNRLIPKRNAIDDFIKNNTSYYVSADRRAEIEASAAGIMKTGVKEKDAYHVACAMLAECEYFITTDDRLLRYVPERMRIVSPCVFIQETEDYSYDK